VPKHAQIATIYINHVTRVKAPGSSSKETAMSTDDGIERDIVEYLGAHYGIEPGQITEESTLADLGVDSLGLLVAADIIENKYRISLDDERIASVRTLRDLKNLVAVKRAEKAFDSTTLVPNTGIGATS